MTGAPSGDTSILDEGSSSKAVRRRGGGVLRSLLRCLALIGLTLVVAAYFASPARGASPLVVLFEAVTADARADASIAAGSSGAQHWDALDDAVQIVEMKVVESDGDDDKDPRCDVAAEEALAFRTVPVPSKPERVLRGGPPSDPSCFAAGTGLPRGPPV